MAIALQNYCVQSMVTPPRTPQFQIKSEPYDQQPETPRTHEEEESPKNLNLHQTTIKTEPLDETYKPNPYSYHNFNPYHHHHHQQQQQPPPNHSQIFENPLGNLQTRFGQISPNHQFPQTSRPELPVTPESPPNPSGNDSSSEGILELPGTPKKSQQKPKLFKCRMCEHVANTKEESWVHLKTHLKPEKMLCCPRCPFVTEYKHHLEYHLLNHDGSKPFVCPECEYMCVNKSMLRSHLKSHSQIYQYRCKDCDYVSKYCHTFKIHLRKYRHEPGPVLNPDGSEDRTKIIDVYGSRRGPRKRTVSIENQTQTNNSNNNNNNNNLNPWPPVQNQIQMQSQSPLEIPNPLGVPKMVPDENAFAQNPLFNPFLVNSMVLAQFMNLQRFVAELRNRNVESNGKNETNNNDDYTCNVCGISFKTESLFGIHMQYHDTENPLKCTTCGKINESGEGFFIHLTRERH